MRYEIAIDVTDDGKVRIGEMTFVPRRFSATIAFEGDHTIVLDIEVNDGRPECSAVHVLRGDGQPRLSGDELRKLPVTSWVTEASKHAAAIASAGRIDRSLPVQPDDGLKTAIEDHYARSADVDRAVRRKVPLTTERLEEVAYAWRETSGQATDMAPMLNVSRAQVYRLIKAARDAGLLEPEG